MWSEIVEVAGTVAAGSPWVPILFDAALKGVVVLGLAGVATLLMRRFSAAARHLVWCLAVASLPLLPILSAVSPDWYVLPHWMAVRTNLPDEMSPVTVLEPRVPPEPAGPREIVFPDYAGKMVASPVEPPAPQPVPPNAVEQPETERPAPAALPRPPVGLIDRAPVSQAVPWQAWGLLAWCAGSVVVFAPVGLGMLSLRRLRRTAEPITDGPWILQLEQLSVQLGVSRRTILLRSDRRSMPMHWGILRPKLLLPMVADEWSEDRRRVVLLHELAHVRRRDCLTQLITQVACALYWFNPLVWVALWRMRIECEAACDDLILRAGYRPPDYAEHLLEIVSGLQASGLAAYSSIAMGRRSRLEGRLRAILDRGRNRRTLTRAAVAAIILLLAGVVVPVAMMRAAVGENAAAESRTVEKATTPRETATEPKDAGDQPHSRSPAVELDGGWGHEVHGMQIRLRPERTDWAEGEGPILYLDVRNMRQRDRSLDPRHASAWGDPWFHPYHASLGITYRGDGSSKTAGTTAEPGDTHWYDTPDLPPRLGHVLRPLETLEGIPIVLDEKWGYDERSASEGGGKPGRTALRMPVGTYTVQYRLRLTTPVSDSGRVSLILDKVRPAEAEKKPVDAKRIPVEAKEKPDVRDEARANYVYAAARPVQLRILPSPPLGKTSWGEVGTSGLQMRLILPRHEGEEVPVLTPQRLTADLQLRNTSDRTIRIAEQNTTGGRQPDLYEWLIGLSVDVRTSGEEVRRFFRADDQDGYWSRIGGNPWTTEIGPGQTASFAVRLHKLVDHEGVGLLGLRGRHELCPVLEVRDEKSGLWQGTARGALVPADIRTEAEEM